MEINGVGGSNVSTVQKQMDANNWIFIEKS